MPHFFSSVNIYLLKYYDIYYIVRNFPGGIDALATHYQDLLDNKLAQEGLGYIAEAFSSVESVGPNWIADFEGLPPGEERDLVVRDAYERINVLLTILGVV